MAEWQVRLRLASGEIVEVAVEAESYEAAVSAALDVDLRRASALVVEAAVLGCRHSTEA